MNFIKAFFSLFKPLSKEEANEMGIVRSQDRYEYNLEQKAKQK